VPNNQEPFRWAKTPLNTPDSLSVTLKGSQTLDIEVRPYYMVRDPQFSVNGRKVTARVKVDKIITDAINGRSVERVSLYVNKSQFVDAGNSINKADLAGSAIADLNNVTVVTSDIGAMMPAQNYVFACIGVKVTGVEDMIYSPVQRVTLQ
jgi:hypothetical protein